MNFKIQSSNPDIQNQLEFLFFNQLEDEMSYIFVRRGEYVIEHDSVGGVLGLTLKMANANVHEWSTIDTSKLPPVQCLNRIAMVHLMCFYESPTNFSNFNILVDETIRCECGAEKANTTHAFWCPKH